GRTMIGNLGSSMPFLLPAALVSGVVLCVLLFRHRQKAGYTLAAGSVALLLGALVITLAVNGPIDRQIQSWTTTTVPPDVAALRARGEFYHRLRTFVAVM